MPIFQFQVVFSPHTCIFYRKAEKGRYCCFEVQGLHFGVVLNKTVIFIIACGNIRLPEHALNIRFEKNYFNAWVVICKHKTFQGMVKCMFFKTHV